MSEDITLPAVRVPLVDARGCITREWLPFVQGLYKRSGGFQGFSNQELFGEAASLQSYDELLERIGGVEVQSRGQVGESLLQELLNRISSLEATNRELIQTVQVLTLAQMDTQAAQSLPLPETVERLTVRGPTRLATQTGTVHIGATTYAGTALLHAAGNVDAQAYRVNDVQVIGAQDAGYVAMTGTANKSTAYATGTVTLPQLAGRVMALQATLTAHGLIGV